MVEKHYETVAEALTDKDAEVTVILQTMQRAGVSEFGQKLVDDALRHTFRGIFLARLQSIEPGEVEDALINIFCMSLIEMMLGRVPKDQKQGAVDLAQEMVNDAAALIADQIEEHWGSNIIIPNGAKAN